MGVLIALLPTLLPLIPSLITTVEGLFGKNKGADKMATILAMLQALISQLQKTGALPGGVLPGNNVLQPLIETILAQMKLTGKIDPSSIISMLSTTPVTPVVVMKENNTMSTESVFNTAYWLAKDPKVRALNDIPDFNTRQTAAMMLASQGFAIDVPIMVWDWSPYLVMLQRANYGYVWVPSALETPISIAPGVAQPGTVPYDPAHPSSNSIKVSVNLADYPPFNPPVVAPVPPSVTSLVGIDTGAGFFSAVLPDAPKSLKDGDTYKEARGTFTFHIAHSPFGTAYYFTQS